MVPCQILARNRVHTSYLLGQHDLGHWPEPWAGRRSPTEDGEETRNPSAWRTQREVAVWRPAGENRPCGFLPPESL